MKKRLQGLVIGVLMGIIFTSGIAIAANTTTLYDVIANGVKIVVDGQKLNPTDANGNKVEPIIYNGTTYLPVRAVANALGKAVYWDGPNYTVYLGDMDGKLVYPTVELENMQSISNPHKIARGKALIDNYGNTYDRAVYKTFGCINYEYLLNMKYSRLKGTLYVLSGETTSETCTFKIIADGRTIYTSPQLSKQTAPIDIDINVAGCNVLRIEMGETVWDDLHIGFANAGFYQ
ncbi:MAG: hypothetical protein E7418_05150 [Ruminococcaceae bacterium]|nr:hypothetical protein [Oscillospiraceae bacterium]